MEWNNGPDPFKAIEAILKRFRVDRQPGLPPFLGGAIGFVSYDAKDLIESKLCGDGKAPSIFPKVYFDFFDEGIVLDHTQTCAFLFAGRAARLRDLESLFKKTSGVSRSADCADGSKKIRGDARPCLGRSEFVELVRRAKRYIRKGEVYQANISQRFELDLSGDALSIYERLRQVNPSPFFGFLDAGHFQIVSGSPERLLKLEGGWLETRPIAGTRARGSDEAEDRRLSLDLLLNEKERAEHIMLVDLERNDLGKVCEPGSVAVDELMTLEHYSHVKHIVSNIRGKLAKDKGAVDAFKAFFPGGTITGVPKVRCMQILDELEPVARGPYTGSLGYLSFTGDMDFNILIRSLFVKGRKAYLQTGAWIVADSVPSKEYDETLHKAEGIFTAVFGGKKTRSIFSRCRASA